MTPNIEIETFTQKRGEKAGQTFYSVWFWVEGKCVHIGFFDSHFEAERAGDKVLEAVELTRHAIRKLV